MGAQVRAQPGDVSVTDQDVVPWRSPMDGFAPPATAVSGPPYMQPLSEPSELVGEPPWDVSLYRSSAWRS